jgi:hypothetical protein
MNLLLALLDLVPMHQATSERKSQGNALKWDALPTAARCRRPSLISPTAEPYGSPCRNPDRSERMKSRTARAVFAALLATVVASGSFHAADAADKFMFRPMESSKRLLSGDSADGTGTTTPQGNQPTGIDGAAAPPAQSAAAAATAHRYWRFRATSARSFSSQYKLQYTGLMFLDASGNAIVPTSWYEPGTVVATNQIANLFDNNAATIKQWYAATSGGMSAFGNTSSVRVDFGSDTAISGISIDAFKNSAPTNGFYTYPPLAWVVEYSDSGYPGPWTVAFSGSNSQANWEANQHYQQIVP